MELVVMGSGAAYPGPHQASSGYLIRDGQTGLLVDCGNGVVSKLQEAGEMDNVTALLFSHLHADHLLDIFPLFYARLYGKGKVYPTLPVFMPPGEVERFARLAEVLRVDTRKLCEQVFSVREYDPAGPLSVDALSISFLKTVHPVPAYALRIEDGRGSMVFSADTGPLPELADFARGCDLLLCEASIGPEDFDPDHAIHLTPAMAAEVAASAGARQLLLTHIWPFYDRQEMLQQAKAVFPQAELAEELNRYQIA
ncbi:MAG TPA: MBL fold metallo-hydrolase [Chloroflexota bacterium]|nr:MBL fold metallo-hydrolase [Chloroflexota bacterium]